jgi:SNF2 family DNA or RNA helicase
MEEVKLEGGRLLIPTQLVLDKLKPGVGRVREVMASHFPGVRYKPGYWVTFANPTCIVTCNILFGTAFASQEYDTSKISFPFKMPPRRHQLQALAASRGKKGFAYFMEPGLGKTKVTIDEAMILHRDGEVDSVAVFCPKSVIPVWLREIRKHGYSDDWSIQYWNSDASPSRIQVIHGPARPQMYWLIVGVESSIFPKTSAVIERFLCCSSKTMVVYDESTTIKNPDAKRSVAAWKFRTMAEYRRILTGTPLADGNPMDFYSQMTFLDPEIFSGMSFRSYQHHYAIMGGFKNRDILGYQNQGELASIIAEYSYTARMKDCLDLPPQTFQTREIELTPANLRNYRAIVNEVLIQVAERTMTIDMMGTKIMKLRQLCGGAILDDEGTVIPVGTEKLDDLMAMMAEHGSAQVIVWCVFVHEIHAIHDRMTKAGYTCVEYYGATKIEERGRIEEDFEKGKIQVAVIQVDTGSLGLTLNAAAISYFYSNPRYLLPRIQAECRNFRDGQTKPTFVIDAFIKGTVDETIYKDIQRKRDFSETFMGALSDPKAMEDLLYGGG